MITRFLPALGTLLVLSGCGKAPDPAPDPKALEQFLAKVEAQDRAARADAVVEARRKEQARIRAAEKRLERYRTDPSPPAEGPSGSAG